MLIDTHCHLDFKDFDNDRDEVIERARESGVSVIINVGTSLESCEKTLELAKKHSGIFASLGVHPHGADKTGDEVISKLKDMAKDKKVVAIGETGLDFYRNKSPRDVQKALFAKFIRLSRELQLPLIIHNREADEEVLSLLKEEAKGEPRGVMHCFSGDRNFLKRCLDAGLLVSFTCNLSFKNAFRLKDTAAFAPIDKILLETDAPFLAPEAHRGKRNEPSYIRYLAKELARIKNMTVEDIESITTENAARFFNLKKEASGI